MAAKLFGIIVVTAVMGGWAEAYPPRYNAQMNWHLPRLFQAACRMKNSTSGEVVHDDECKCGDQTVACDVGPINHFGIEMTFCNKLDEQTDDQLYIMQYACVSGQGANCGIGTNCDIGPLTYGGAEHYLCRLASSTNFDDFEDMCKPVDPLTQPPMFGLGAGMGGRWKNGAAGNGQQQWGPGMGRKWNNGAAGNGQQQWGPGMGRKWNNGAAGNGQQQWGPGMGRKWNNGAAANGQQQWGPGMGGRWNNGAAANGQQQWGPGMGRRWNQDNGPANSPVTPPTGQQQWGPGWGFNQAGGAPAPGQGVPKGMGRRGRGRRNW